MKKIIKKVLIVVGVIVGIIILDSIQALVFDNNPIIGIQTRNMKKVGILVDTHHCGNGKHDTVIKGFSYSCNYKGGKYTLVDETKEIEASSYSIERVHYDMMYDMKIYRVKTPNGVYTVLWEESKGGLCVLK